MDFPSESLVGHGLAFLPFQARGLASGAVPLLVKSVIDIAPDVPCSTEVILACQELRNAGYRSVACKALVLCARPLLLLSLVVAQHCCTLFAFLFTSFLLVLSLRLPSL